MSDRESLEDAEAFDFAKSEAAKRSGGFKPTKPTHKLKAKLRDGAATADLGVAWLRKDGSFSVQLNVGVALRWDDPLVISLFPIGS